MWISPQTTFRSKRGKIFSWGEEILLAKIKPKHSSIFYFLFLILLSSFFPSAHSSNDSCYSRDLYYLIDFNWLLLVVEEFIWLNWAFQFLCGVSISLWHHKYLSANWKLIKIHCPEENFIDCIFCFIFLTSLSWYQLVRRLFVQLDDRYVWITQPGMNRYQTDVMIIIVKSSSTRMCYKSIDNTQFQQFHKANEKWREAEIEVHSKQQKYLPRGFICQYYFGLSRLHPNYWEKFKRRKH